MICPKPQICNYVKHTEGQKNDATANKHSIDENKIVEIENETENSIENIEHTSETRNSNIDGSVEIGNDQTSEQNNFSANETPD